MKAALRAKLEARSGGVCERCAEAEATQAHHALFRSRGGPDELWNLYHLCLRCHQQVHDAGEAPYVVPGYFLRGRYVGPDERFAALTRGESGP